MKTKKLTFLLALTFLFLFSGSVYGGVIDETIDDVFDRKGEVVGLYCPTRDLYFSINLKEKNIKLYKEYKDDKRELLTNMKIIKETGIYIIGKVEDQTLSYFIDRHVYLDKNIIKVEVNWKIGDEARKDQYKCLVGEKKF